MQKENMLEVKNLKKHFNVKGSKNKVVYAVDGINFSIKKGETFGLVGESGCGKSTVARTIIRIYDPTDGEIVLDGIDIGKLKKKNLGDSKKKMQMIFQDPYSSLNGRMTVLDIIAEPLIAQGIIKKPIEAKDQIVEMLSSIGLAEEHCYRYPHEFSGGQRQRIGIARALIAEPELVICDEAISALDVSIQAQVINLLQKFQEERELTYLFIAHDLSMVRYVSDVVGVMYLGKMVEICPSEEIYSKPLHPYTVGLLGAVPIADPTLAKQKVSSSIEGDLPSPMNPPSGCRFHTRCNKCMDICESEEPKLIEIAANHKVACHLYK